MINAEVDTLVEAVLEKLASVDWDFTDNIPRNLIHDIHPYPARFIPQIPRELIRLFHPGDKSPILDPFCGSGTTLVEAVAEGIPATGVDLNPLAHLIAKVKTSPLPCLIEPIARDVASRARKGTPNIPAIPRLDHWFLPQGNRILKRENFEEVILIPASPLALGFDTHFGRLLLLEHV